MSTPTPDALKALQARHHRIAADHMIASDHLAGFLREVSAEKVGTKALREKIAALGITPRDLDSEAEELYVNGTKTAASKRRLKVPSYLAALLELAFRP